MNYLNYHFIVDLKCERTMAKIGKPKDRYIIIIILVYDPDIFFITPQAPILLSLLSE